MSCAATKAALSFQMVGGWHFLMVSGWHFYCLVFCWSLCPCVPGLSFEGSSFLCLIITIMSFRAVRKFLHLPSHFLRFPLKHPAMWLFTRIFCQWQELPFWNCHFPCSTVLARMGQVHLIPVISSGFNAWWALRRKWCQCGGNSVIAGVVQVVVAVVIVLVVATWRVT